MHLFIKSACKKVWISTYLFVKKIRHEIEALQCCPTTLCCFLCFLLHVLSKTALLSAPQAVQCEVWVSAGGSVCEKRDGTKWEGRQREGGREKEDDGTGVEFTHPAGSAHDWHICFGVMSHSTSYGGSERKCGVCEREGDTNWNIEEWIVCRMFHCLSQAQGFSQKYSNSALDFNTLWSFHALCHLHIINTTKQSVNTTSTHSQNSPIEHCFFFLMFG